MHPKIVLTSMWLLLALCMAESAGGPRQLSSHIMRVDAQSSACVVISLLMILVVSCGSAVFIAFARRRYKQNQPEASPLEFKPTSDKDNLVVSESDKDNLVVSESDKDNLVVSESDKYNLVVSENGQPIITWEAQNDETGLSALFDASGNRLHVNLKSKPAVYFDHRTQTFVVEGENVGQNVKLNSHLQMNIEFCTKDARKVLAILGGGAGNVLVGQSMENKRLAWSEKGQNGRLVEIRVAKLWKGVLCGSRRGTAFTLDHAPLRVVDF